jgi:hypothetical protein
MKHLKLFEEFGQRKKEELSVKIRRLFDKYARSRAEFFDKYKEICIIFNDESYAEIRFGKVEVIEDDQLDEHILDMLDRMTEYKNRGNFYKELALLFDDYKNVNYVFVSRKDKKIDEHLWFDLHQTIESVLTNLGFQFTKSKGITEYEVYTTNVVHSLKFQIYEIGFGAFNVRYTYKGKFMADFKTQDLKKSLLEIINMPEHEDYDEHGNLISVKNPFLFR